MAMSLMGNIYGPGASGWWHDPMRNSYAGTAGSWHVPSVPSSGYANSYQGSTSAKLAQSQAAAQPSGGYGYGYSSGGNPWDAANAANQARANRIELGYNEMRAEIDSQSDQLTRDAKERNAIELSRIKQDMAARGLTGSTVAWAPNVMQNRELDRNLNYIQDQRLQNRLGVMQGFANFLERQNDIAPSFGEALAIGQAGGFGGAYPQYASAYGYGFGGAGSGSPSYSVPYAAYGTGYRMPVYGFSGMTARSGRSPTATMRRMSDRAAVEAGYARRREGIYV